jgi:hypothetical protein
MPPLQRQPRRWVKSCTQRYCATVTKIIRGIEGKEAAASMATCTQLRDTGYGRRPASHCQADTRRRIGERYSTSQTTGSVWLEHGSETRIWIAASILKARRRPETLGGEFCKTVESLNAHDSRIMRDEQKSDRTFQRKSSARPAGTPTLAWLGILPGGTESFYRSNDCVTDTTG